MRIFNPTFGETPQVQAAAKLTHDWARAKIVLFDNSKPNAHELLQGISMRIAKRFNRTEPFGTARKEHAAAGAATSQLAELAANYSIALVGAGD